MSEEITSLDEIKNLCEEFLVAYEAIKKAQKLLEDWHDKFSRVGGLIVKE